MLAITHRQVKVASLVALIAYLAFGVTLHLERHGYLGETVARAVMWRHQGLLLPVWLFYVLSIVLTPISICGLVGTALFRSWGRRLLALSLVANFIAGPLQGIVVHGPLSLLAVSVYSLLHVWLVTVTYWSPISEAFGERAKPAAT